MVFVGGFTLDVTEIYESIERHDNSSQTVVASAVG
jgi:hypothetical protein